MIVKDSRDPRGRFEEQPRSAFTVLTGALERLAYGEGRSWRDSDEVFERRTAERKARPAVVTTTVRPTYDVVCRAHGCSRVFTTSNVRRIYCSERCTQRVHRATNRARFRERYGPTNPHPRRREPTMASCHPDRPMVARGLCRPCYNGLWKKGRFVREH